MSNVKLAKVIDVIKNTNGDTFIRHANGILEVFFSRKLDLVLNTTGVLVSTGDIEMPQDVLMVKGIHTNVTVDANGIDVTLAGVNLVEFKRSCQLKRLYCYAYATSVSQKIFNFHCIGRWK